MKKLLLFALSVVSLVFLTTKSFAQSTNVICQINSECDSVFVGTGCEVWVLDHYGNVVTDTTIDSSGFTQLSPFVYNSTLAPYYVMVDSTCLWANNIHLHTYILDTIDSLSGPSNPYYLNYSLCSYDSLLSVSFVSFCGGAINDTVLNHYPYNICAPWIKDAQGNYVTSFNMYSNRYGPGATFQYHSSHAPYSLVFNKSCSNSVGIYFSDTSGTPLTNYTFTINDSSLIQNHGLTGNDSLYACVNYYPDSVTLLPEVTYEIITACDSGNSFATGCTVWVENNLGDTVISSTVDSTGITQDSFSYNSLYAPYYIKIDSNCLNANNHYLNSYLIDSVYNIQGYWNHYLFDSVCPPDSQMVLNLYSVCGGVSNDSVLNYYPQVCNAWIENSSGTTVSWLNLRSSGFGKVSTFNFHSSQAPYTLHFDKNCLNSRGIFLSDTNGTPLSNYSFVIDSSNSYSHGLLIKDSIYFCMSFNQDSVSVVNYTINYTPCDSLSYNTLYDSCLVWIADASGDTVTSEIDYSAQYYGLSFNYNPSLAPYTLNFDKSCYNSHGVQLTSYSYPISDSINGNTASESFSICSQYMTNCSHLFSSFSICYNYFSDSTGCIEPMWHNPFPHPQLATLTLTLPAGVTTIPSTFSYPWVQSGSQLTLSTTVPASSYLYDDIGINIPSNIPNGTPQEYTMHYSLDTAVDCDTLNNTAHYYVIVGQSFDPNNLIVNKPTDISSNIRDTLIYGIHFQNTGTAPAQNIYILDTLSQNLDWNTFQLLNSTDTNVIVNNLGNGIMKFVFNNIWLPDSATDFAGSKGYVSYKILENASNGNGTKIYNTAYIYFDQNAPIATNTTYNINVNNLSVPNLRDNSRIISFVYPNPATQYIELKANKKINSIMVYSLSGKLISSARPNNKEVRLDIKNLASGIYFVKLISNNAVKVMKFIKQ